MKIGIVGARGIGKHHAKWFARASCEVVAIYGTTEESAQAAAAGLSELFGFTGAAFHDWNRFRTEGGFDACSVCSPAESHCENVLDLAADGKHILCEKPLVWNWDYAPLQMLEDGTAIVEAAARHGVLLGVNAQYPVALDGYRQLHQEVRGEEPRWDTFRFVLETRGKPRSPHGPAEAWVDLAPHALALLDTLAPGGIDWETLRHTDGPNEAVVDFDWVSGDRRIPAHVECRRITEGTMRRQMGTDDLVVDVDGCTIEGEFSARLRAGEREWTGPDFMRVSIERFIQAARTGNEDQLLISGRAALRQQEALVGVWQRCWR